MSLQKKVLSMTGCFETSKMPPGCFSKVTGNFDGQGISFGALQFNLGQNTLQPILKRMLDEFPLLMEEIFRQHVAVLANVLDKSIPDQIAWANSISTPKKTGLVEPWNTMFEKLGKTEACQEYQVQAAKSRFSTAYKYIKTYDCFSERAVALMFDIVVQNGSISPGVRAAILKAFKEIDAASPNEIEVAKMVIIATKRAEAANPRWVNDVKARKLCIARGHGVVHGVYYDLEKHFGIGLVPAEVE